jgi:ribonuclease R
LIAHRILKTNKIPKELESLIEFLNSQEEKIDKLVDDFSKRVYARWAIKNLNKTFKAKIINIQEPKAIFEEFPLGLVVYLQNYNGERLLSNITVKLVDANFITKKVIGEIVEKTRF